MEGFYTQEHCTIFGRNVWHYLAVLPIGQIHIIEYEGKDNAMHRTIIDESNSKAERLFKNTCKKMLEMKI